MFYNSVALIQTHDKNWFAHLHSLVLQAGFKESRAFPENSTSLSQFRRGPLPFIFVHASLKDEQIQRVFSSVRAHADVSIRFLPIVVLSEACDVNTIVRFIQMGCDDIVSLPLTAAALIDRLKHQIGRTKDFYQTDTYFGPDRRQHDITKASKHSGRGKGEHFFRHFSIQRHHLRGVSILSSDVHFPSEQNQQRATA